MNFKYALFLAFAFACRLLSPAQDKSLLDALVAKGALTPLEASEISKQSAAAVTPLEPDTKSLKISAMMQLQYGYLHTDAQAPLPREGADRNSLGVRRLFLGAAADLGSGFGGVIDLDLCASGNANAKYLNVAFLSKTVDYEYLKGTLCAGYLKVHFGIDEKTPASQLLAVDRSLVTRYFTFGQKAGSGNVGFGSAYTGLFWDGKSSFIDGLNYGFAVTDAENWRITAKGSDAYKDSLNIWANVFYLRAIDIGLENKVNLKLGFNFGYGGGANSKNPVSGSADSCGQIWGIDPYLQLKWGPLTLSGEFIMTGIEYGRNMGSENATPYGFNIVGEYLFDIGDYGRIGPILRYSGLNTNGRGARISDCLFAAENLDTSGDNPANLYDTAKGVYAGINWYLDGDNMKLQVGYEWVEFAGNPSFSANPHKRAEVNSVRVQLQMKF